VWAAARDRSGDQPLARKKDYYEFLGDKQTATSTVIEKAYWNLARIYHKKSARNKSAKRRLLTLNEAYENLASPDKREAYDRQRQQLQETDEAPGLWRLLRRIRCWNGHSHFPAP